MWFSGERLKGTLSRAAVLVSESHSLKETLSRAAETVRNIREETGPDDVATRMAQKFDREARGLFTVPPEAAVETLRRWEGLLTGQEEVLATETLAGTTAELLSAFLRSGALLTAVDALVGSPEHRAALLLPGDTGAGAIMQRLFSLVSSLPSESLACLLPLLLEAQEMLDSRMARGEETAVASAMRLVEWARQMLVATHRDWQEVELLRRTTVDNGVRQEMMQDACRHEALSEGTAVWAVWSGDGQWYRATVRAVVDDYADVEWSSAPEGCPEDCGFLRSGSSSGSDDAKHCMELSASKTRINLERVIERDTAEGECPRPSCLSADERLSGVNTLTQRCRKLKSTLKGYHKQSFGLPPLSDYPSCGASDVPLLSIAATLRSMREEREAQAEKLREEAVRCASAEEGCQSQMRTSSDSYRAEIAELRQQQVEANSHLDALVSERAAAQQRLEELDLKVDAAKASSSELKKAERRLRSSMQAISKKLCEQLSTEGRQQEVSVEESRLILRARSVALVVEEDVDLRAAALVSAVQLTLEHGGVWSTLAAACMRSENSRMAALEELWAGCKVEVWGPGWVTLEGDSHRLGDLKRVAHQAAGVAESSAREAESLSKQFLRSGLHNLEVHAGECSDLVERYRQLRQQFLATLSRLVQWQDSLLAVAMDADEQSTSEGEGGLSSDAWDQEDSLFEAE